MNLIMNALVLFGLLWIWIWPVTLVFGLFQYLIAKNGGKKSKGLIIPIIMYIIPFALATLVYLGSTSLGFHHGNSELTISLGATAFGLVINLIFPGIMYLFYILVRNNNDKNNKDNNIDKMKAQDL